jgi:hypothetical protein
MSSFYGKKQGEQSYLEKVNQDWASQYESQIEQARRLGKAEKPSLWEGVKRMGSEALVDVIEAVHPQVKGYEPIYSGDLDAKREQALRAEMNNAQKFNEYKKNYPNAVYEPTSSWKKLRDNGSY